MSAHSPGPWRWETIDGNDTLLDADDHPVIEGDWAIGAANARLFAAAPTLLDRLRQVSTRCGCCGGCDDCREDEALITSIDGAATPPAEPTP